MFSQPPLSLNPPGPSACNNNNNNDGDEDELQPISELALSQSAHIYLASQCSRLDHNGHKLPLANVGGLISLAGVAATCKKGSFRGRIHEPEVQWADYVDCLAAAAAAEVWKWRLERRA